MSLVVDDSGKVGIGTPTPIYPLDVTTAVPDDFLARFTSGSTKVYLSDARGYGMQINTDDYKSRGIYALSVGNAQATYLYVGGDGYVGIGTPDPSYPLDVTTAQTDDFLARFTNGLTKVYLSDARGYGMQINTDKYKSRGIYALSVGNALDTYLYVGGDGNVGIGTPDPTAKLDVAGEALIDGVKVPSDARFKTNVTPVANALDKLKELRAVSFQWNELYESLGRSTGQRREVGLVAQDVEAVFPELVSTWGDEGYKAVDYGRLTAVLVEAVRELKVENEALKQRTEALEAATGDN